MENNIKSLKFSSWGKVDRRRRRDFKKSSFFSPLFAFHIIILSLLCLWRLCALPPEADLSPGYHPVFVLYFITDLTERHPYYCVVQMTAYDSYAYYSGQRSGEDLCKWIHAFFIIFFSHKMINSEIWNSFGESDAVFAS